MPQTETTFIGMDMAKPDSDVTVYYWFDKNGNICSGPTPPAHTQPAALPEIKMPSRAWRDRNVCTRKD